MFGGCFETPQISEKSPKISELDHSLMFAMAPSELLSLIKSLSV